MSTPNIEHNEGQGSVTHESILDNNSDLNELNYTGLSDCSSSVDSSSISIASAESTNNLNLKATELRLGLPGSQSPARDKKIVSGIKRGFSDAHCGFSEGKICNSDAQANLGIRSGPLKECLTSPEVNMKEVASSLGAKVRAPDLSNSSANVTCTANHKIALAPKAQVVGWPPIRSYRKHSIATTSKNTDEVDGILRKGVLFVKVSMDGAPYLRKVDIKAYNTYQELSSALEKMFSCFSIDQCRSQLTTGEEVLGDNKPKDLVHGSEYVLAYEDKDSDWMLVGDVPWEMFVDTCRRLRIMKSSDAIGLAPRAVDKCKNRS